MALYKKISNKILNKLAILIFTPIYQLLEFLTKNKCQ